MACTQEEEAAHGYGDKKGRVMRNICQQEINDERAQIVHYGPVPLVCRMSPHSSCEGWNNSRSMCTRHSLSTAITDVLERRRSEFKERDVG